MIENPGIKAFDNTQRQPVFAPGVDQNTVQSLVNNIEKVSCRMPTFPLFLEQIFGIKRWQRRSDTVQTKEIGDDFMSAIRQLANTVDIRIRKAQSQLRSDTQTPLPGAVSGSLQQPDRLEKGILRPFFQQVGNQRSIWLPSRGGHWKLTPEKTSTISTRV